MRLLSLRARIFTALVSVVLVASLLMAGVTIFQYSEQSNTYHEQRLQRKENQLKKRLAYLLDDSTYQLIPENTAQIFAGHVAQTSDVLNINFRVYSLNGTMVPLEENTSPIATQPLPEEVLRQLAENPNDHYIDVRSDNGIRTRSSYFYIFDQNELPLAIIYVPYFDDDSLSYMELQAYLWRLVQVYIIMLIIALLLAFFVSSYITQSLDTIIIKLNQTRLSKTNTKIELTNASKEISALVDAYNQMVDQLEESAAELAKSQREVAWREMAKQVAHEIKNPLTPMRLSIQQFEKQHGKGTATWNAEVRDFSQTLIQQIDTMSAIASTFSQFATMPMGQPARIDVVETVARALELYKETPIWLNTAPPPLYAQLDSTQLVRVVNNVVSNAIQATKGIENPKIEVAVSADDTWVYFTITDNGEGISEEVQARIFEPMFTTKTSGMGLGLSMVKSIVETYGGNVDFDSKPNISTCFRLRFPRVH